MRPRPPRSRLRPSRRAEGPLGAVTRRGAGGGARGAVMAAAAVVIPDGRKGSAGCPPRGYEYQVQGTEMG